MEERLPNPTNSRYRILSKLGEGGMGEVYLAEDTLLERKVAVKFLAGDYIDNGEGLRRFVQEAKAASALNHPNILTIHEIGEMDGRRFIASEYVNGTTLGDKLTDEPLDVGEALNISIQIAEALAAAHSAGIVHRDIKPENVIVREDGIAKVVDFGLAKLTVSSNPEADTRPQVKTKSGTILGTAFYMSPEQARGRPIDERTDIFSLGVVMYRMLAGQLPFRGETMVDTIAAILRTEPKSVRSLNADLPAELERIIDKTLEKDRDERYQSAKELLVDLKHLRKQIEITNEIKRTYTTSELQDTKSGRAYQNHDRVTPKRTFVIAILSIVVLGAVGIGYWLYTTPSGEQIDSIAVLPFQNKSSEPDTEYLSDGLAESLIYRLSQLPNLKVSPTSTVFRYRGNETDPVKIGEELGVDAVLFGRIVQRGDNLKISVDLLDVTNKKQLWGEQYDRKTADLLATQREIAGQIVSALALKVAGDEKALNKHYTENNEAYRLFLKGRFYWNKRTPESIRKAIEYFNQAIEKDPGFALAYVGLADAYVVPANGLPPREAMPKAKAAAMRALEIDDTLAEAHTSLGRVLQVYDWNWKEAEKEFKRAIELDPRYPVAHQWYGGYLERTGRVDEGIAERKLTLELDPLSTITNFELGQAYFFARDYDKAIVQLQRTLELDPSFPPALQYLPVNYLQKGMYDEALLTIRETPESAAIKTTGVPAYALAVTGRTGQARTMLDELKRLREQQYVTAVGIALVYVGLGERDEALAWLEKGYEERAFQMQFLKLDPRWDSLRSDPRFADLVRRIGFPE